MNIHYDESKSRTIANVALIAGVYVVVTFLTAPFAYGPLNFRIAEGLNFLALYKKRHIWAVTLGVFIANYFAFGPLDMVVGSLSTLVFLYLGRWLADRMVQWLQSHYQLSIDPMLIKYGILAIIFSLSMITIALMIQFLGYDGPFLPLFGGLVLSELIAMVLGGMIIYPLSQRINFKQ